MPLAGAELAADLEGVDRLADGRLVFLSERLRSLVGEGGLIAEYDSLFGEFANRGLEGVAVRSLSGGTSRVAVVWEGGYPDYASVPFSARSTVGRQAMRPLVVIHDLQPGANGLELKLRNAVVSAELDVPKPPGDEPEAQRFRAPDLVWTRCREGAAADWAILVLVSSQNSTDRPLYQYHWLLRFNLLGKPIGDPIDIDRLVPQEIQGTNWEGLSWFEKGKSVVLVHEGNKNIAPHAFVLDLPEDWRFSAAELSKPE